MPISIPPTAPAPAPDHQLVLCRFWLACSFRESAGLSGVSSDFPLDSRRSLRSTLVGSSGEASERGAIALLARAPGPARGSGLDTSDSRKKSDCFAFWGFYA